MTQVYTIRNVDINDSEQLDQFFSSYLQPYNRLLYFADARTLNVYTAESASSTDTLAAINSLIAKYPNPTPDFHYEQYARSAGDLITYDADANALSPVSVGTPGQMLTADPSSTKGFGWRTLDIEGGSGSRFFNSDLYCRYFEIYNSGSEQQVGQSPTAVKFSNIRRKDTPTYGFSPNYPEFFSINEGGSYTITAKLGIQWRNVYRIPSYDAVVKCFVSVVPPGAADAEPIVYSTFYMILPSTVSQDISVTRLTQFNYNSVNGGERFYLYAQEVTPTDNVVVARQVNQFSAMKLIIGTPATDVSQYYNAYDATGNLTISSNDWTVIPVTTNTAFLNNVNLGPNFIAQPDGSVSTDGLASFYMYFKIGLQATGASVGDHIVCNFRMTYNAGGGWTEFPNTRKTLFFTITSTAYPVMKTNAIISVIGFPPNTVVRFEATVVSNTGTGIVTTIPNVSMVFFLATASSDVGSNNVHGFEAYNTNTVSLYKNIWTDVPFDNILITDGIFGQNTDKTILQSSQPGTYIISFRLGIHEPNGTQYGETTTRLMINSGSGFYEVVGSTNSIFYQGNEPSASIGFSLIYLGYNNQIKLQTCLEDIGPNSSSYAELGPNYATLIVAKFENTIEPLATPGSTAFGANHLEVERLENEVTVSTSYVPKLQMIANNLPQGTYRINWKFSWSASCTNQSVLALVTQDNNTQLASYNFTPEQSHTTETSYDFQILSLTSGNHTFQISWATSDASCAAYMSKAKMEIWRVA